MPDVIVEPLAQADIEEAHDWYEERQHGLGERFELAIDAALRWVGEHVTACREVAPGVRRFVVKEFPYCLFFQVHGGAGHLIAVLHAARNPNVWKNRTGI